MSSSSRHPLSFPLAAGGLLLVALLSIPSIWTIVGQIRRGAPKNNFYEDRDGKSTPEAVAEFSNRKPKAAVLLFSLVGLGTSIAISVLAVTDSKRDQTLDGWFATASWVRTSIPIL